MHDFPWLQAVVSWGVALALGIRIGRFSITHKEYIVTRREHVRAWFDRWALVLYSVVAVLALSGIALGGNNALQNSRDLVTSCQNANASREASRALWGYILDVSTSNNPHPTKVQREFYDDFRGYINAVYVPHDCTDLSKKYPLPDPPKVITVKHHQG